MTSTGYAALVSAWKDTQWRKNARINKDNRAKSRHGLIAHFMGAKSRRHLVEELTVDGKKPTVSRVWDRMFSKSEEGETIWTNEDMQKNGAVIRTGVINASQPDPDNPSATILPSVEQHMKIVAYIIGVGRRGSVLELRSDASLIFLPPPERRRSKTVEEELSKLSVEDQRRQVEHQRALTKVQA